MSKTSPRLCAAGVKLRTQINKFYPKRDKASDGWIGDARHTKTKSDHNPDKKTGVVRALDIDSNLGKDIDSMELAESLRLLAKGGEKRIAYIIHNKKIASTLLGWAWRPYLGSNPHLSHIHVSFSPLGDADGKAFGVKPIEKKSTPPTRKTAEPVVSDSILAEIAAVKKTQADLDKRIKALEAKVKRA
jgi:hypothetical protein